MDFHSQLLETQSLWQIQSRETQTWTCLPAHCKYIWMTWTRDLCTEFLSKTFLLTLFSMAPWLLLDLLTFSCTSYACNPQHSIKADLFCFPQLFFSTLLILCGKMSSLKKTTSAWSKTRALVLWSPCHVSPTELPSHILENFRCQSHTIRKLGKRKEKQATETLELKTTL